jgi:hypothetical protein
MTKNFRGVATDEIIRNERCITIVVQQLFYNIGYTTSVVIGVTVSDSPRPLRLRGSQAAAGRRNEVHAFGDVGERFAWRPLRFRGS